MVDNRRNAVRVILDFTDLGPSCTHGPMLLFEMNNDPSTRYFACSAYRDRKQCPAFISFPDWHKTKKKEISTIKRWQGSNDLQEKSGRMEAVRKNILQAVTGQKSEDRHYCHTCNELLVDKKLHINHQLSIGFSDEDLSNPLQLMQPLDSKKKEAQFLFTPASRNVIASLVDRSKSHHCLCVASPTIFQHMRKTAKVKCLMLDLDVRLRQFFSPEEYLLYNMFNHYFFDGASGEATFTKFLEESHGNLALVIDPPFGGKVDVLAHTLKKIFKQYSDIVGDTSKMSVFLILPYFMEPQVINQLPDFKMMDYKVNYLNHKQFQDGEKGRKQGSPVRIFTNVPLESLPLPKEEGYSFCKFCKKWKSKENVHCLECGICTSKDGRTYVHCKQCNRCVKPTWKHCLKCNRCALEEHPCEKFRMSAFSSESRKGCKRKDSLESNALAPAARKEKKKVHSGFVKSSISEWTVTDLS